MVEKTWEISDDLLKRLEQAEKDAAAYRDDCDKIARERNAAEKHADDNWDLYEDAVKDLVKFKEREKRAAELLREAYNDKTVPVPEEWDRKAQQWLKDAGL